MKRHHPPGSANANPLTRNGPAGRRKISDLLDIEGLRSLYDRFTALTRMGTALLDLEGNILIATGWQDICTCFHRVHPLAAARCRESDTALAARLQEGHGYNVYRCRNGLVDVAVPLLIEGEHVGNFFTGQFFFEPPDRAFFIRQAEEFGFDREAYLKALDRVPIFSEAQIRSLMEFFSRLVMMVGDMGRTRKLHAETTTRLAKSEERLELALSSSTEGYWDLDVPTGQFFHSPRFLQMLGYQSGEFPTDFDRFTGLIHPEDRPRAAVAIQTCITTADHCMEVEYRLRERTGSWKWVLCSGTATARSKDGRALRMVGTHRDISGQKQAEHRLQQSETRYRALFEKMPDALLVFNSQGIIDCNPAAVRLYGVSTLEGLIGRQFSELFPERQTDGSLSSTVLSAHIDEALIGEPKRFESLHRRLDTGETFLTEVVLAPILFDDRTVLSATVRDITAPKQAQEAIRASEEKLRVIIEASPVPMALVDANRSIPLLNPAFVKTFGYTLDDIPTQQAWLEKAYPDPKYRQQILQPWAAELVQAEKAGTPVAPREVVIRCKDGTDKIVEISTISISHTFKGEFLSVVFDLTDRRRAESERVQLEDLNRQLQKADSLSRMAGAIAHHFNNQLQVVSGYLELALDEIPAGPDGLGRIIQNALQASRRASLVSSSMLTYLGKTAAKREPLDLSTACGVGLPLIEATLPKSATLRFEGGRPGPVIDANQDQVQQILANLVTNSWEAGNGTPLSIEVGITTAAATDISNRHRFPVNARISHERYARLEVKDDGAGIAATDIDRIFDPFFTSKFSGRGMGLSVVLGIVRAYEGIITVESKPGRGSVFRLYFPLSSKTLPQPKSQTAAKKAAPAGRKVLLVEDDELVRNLTGQMLNLLGYPVIAARDGSEGVEAFRQHREEIGFVLCDVSMPGMDGWETLTALRQLDPEIPVILASGHSETQVLNNEHTERPQAFLGKPYLLEQLKQAISQAVPVKS